jgi:hypothetical protein
MLFRETVVIIAVCSTITLLFIVLIIIRRYSRPSTPLPTIQPLAHQRVQLLEQFKLKKPSSSSTLSSQQPIVPSTTSKPLPAPPPDPSSGHLSPSNFERRSHSAGSSSSKNSHRNVRPGRVPHLSRIEIVLPVPLALNVRPGVATKATIADRWASAGTGKQSTHWSKSCHDISVFTGQR